MLALFSLATVVAALVIFHALLRMWNDTRGNLFTSPQPQNQDFSAANFNTSPNNTAVNVAQSTTPDIFFLTIPAGANFDSGANPLKLGAPVTGMLFWARNAQASAVKVVGARVGDPGVVIGPGELLLIGVDDLGGMQFISGGGTIPLPPVPAGGDDGASITAALKGVGLVVLERGATYNIATAIDMSAAPGATLYGNGAILTGAMARSGGVANSVILAQPTTTGTGATTLSANVTIGLNTIAVTAGAGIVNGAFIRLRSAAGAQLTQYYQVISGGTTNTLTLDRPIQEPFLNADTVTVVTVMPRDLNIVGPLTINGTGDNGVSFVGVRRGGISGVNVDIQASAAATSLTGGIDLDVGCFDILCMECQATGFNLAGAADQFVVSIGMASCESCRLIRCAGRHATTAAIFAIDCFSCVIDQCEGTDCGGTAAGIAISGTTPANAQGSTDVDVWSSYSGNCAFGLGVALATRTSFHGCTVEGATTRSVDIGTAGTASTDTNFEDLTIIGGSNATATGIKTDAASVRNTFRGLTISGVRGASVIDNNAAQLRVSDYTVTGFGGVNALNLFVIRNTTIDAFFERGIVTMTAGTGGANAFNFVGAAGSRLFIKGLKLVLATNGDTIVSHTTNGITKLTDIDSPTVVAGTFGYNGGAGTLLKRDGRVDMSGAATPYTTSQSDAGTWVVNGATGVDITYFDARAGLQVAWSIVTKGGTPNVQQQTIVAATKVTMAGIAADTSTDSYRFFD